ncbi:unnamed protein product [Owenia fusiformis]|uniref:Uncharacterized protein n=1 Tax=Owenia fusiformis TaxID=6347 RepID=A0A8J1Y2L6_OWEFU|nr:unnamed protein product [Owenia fusiformis]
MATAVQLVNQFLASGQFKPLLAVIKGLRNGAVYGAKIRAPHAVVMTFLFKTGSLSDKLRSIFEATWTHSRNLASFVFLYKTMTSILTWLEEKPEQYHSFFAAFIGGYYVFGNYNKVNEQINLYLLSRIIYGLAKLAVKRGYVAAPKRDVFPVFAALVWGVVLWMFEYEKDTLQPSLRSSMTYLYHDSNIWHNLRDFLIYNR